MLVGLAGHGIQPLGSDESYFCPLDANPTIEEIKAGQTAVAANPETLVSIARGPQDPRRQRRGVQAALGRRLPQRPERAGPAGRGPRQRGRPAEQTGVLLSCKAGEFSFEHKSLGQGDTGVLSSRDRGA